MTEHCLNDVETIDEALNLSKRLQSDSARLDTELLLCHALSCERSYLRVWGSRPLNHDEKQCFLKLFAEREAGRPVAYILGYREFWTLKLKVSEHTLIPRPDTEILVETALALNLPQEASVLDLGTGTGAIALSLAKERSAWKVSGLDLKPEAVALAKENAALNALEHVNFYESDWFSAVAGERYDLIVSNPPYISENDPHLKEGDVRFEPLSALVSRSDGLYDIEHILAEAITYLKEDGRLLIEHGYDQGESVRRLFFDQGYTEVMTVKDYGGQDRVSMGRRPC